MTGAIAVIPARGGSKRIPRKNIRDFLGKPILAYSIEAAKRSALFSQVIVSTDDEEIAEIARHFGAETPFPRPAELANDHVGTNPVVRHVLLSLRALGQRPEIACCIYATAPFVTADFLVEGHRKFTASGKAFAFSVTTFDFPIQRALRMNPDGSVEAFFLKHADSRSQDLASAWHDAGQFYWGRAEAFLNSVPMFAPSSIGVPIPRHMVQDIDSLEDWHHAELMYEVLVRGGNRK